jgi:hypothetical protein
MPARASGVRGLEAMTAELRERLADLGPKQIIGS